VLSLFFLPPQLTRAELGIESEQCLLLVLLKLNVHHSELHVDVLPQLWIILITERVSDLICDCW